MEAALNVCEQCGTAIGVALLTPKQTREVAGRNVASGICNSCNDLNQEVEEEVKRGGVFWICVDCKAAGALKADSRLAKLAREKLGIPVDPCRVKFSKENCPFCTKQLKPSEPRSEFDYITAWEELANPAVVALDKSFFELYEHVCREAAELSQDANCDMSWPTESDLRSKFEKFAEVDSCALGLAACALYYWGHWSSEGHSDVGNGGTWKFANYADQVLRAHLGVNRDVQSGLGFTVHEGKLRVGLSWLGGWTWEELGAPSQLCLDIAKMCFENPPPFYRGRSSRAAPSAFDDYVHTLWPKSAKVAREALSRWNLAYGFHRWLDNKRFMVTKTQFEETMKHQRAAKADKQAVEEGRK